MLVCGQKCSLNNKSSYNGVTLINGPVNLYMFEYNVGTSTNQYIRKFYFFGDVHHSKVQGCDGPCYALRDDRTNLDRESIRSDKFSCINIDAAIHIWLLYNNAKNITTDLYIEAVPPKNDVGPGSSKNNWLVDTSNLITPCLINKNKCPYAPKSKVHAFDFRANSYGGEIDIFFWLSIAQPPIEEILNAAKTIKVIFNNIMTIAKAYILPGAFNRLSQIAELVKNLDTRDVNLNNSDNSNDNSDNSNESYNLIACRNILRGSDHAAECDYIGKDGVARRALMHRLARVLYKLSSRDKEGKKVAVLIYRFYMNTMNDIKKIAENNNSIDLIISLASYGADIKLLTQVFMSSYDAINKIFINLASTVVDCHLLAKMFLKDSRVSIIHSGLAHTTNYVTFFNSYLLLNETYRIDNSLVMRLRAPEGLDIYDIKRCDDIKGLRCVKDETLPNEIDFAMMRQFLIDNDILENAQYTIMDMHEKNKRR